MPIRPVTPADIPAILALNLASVAETSPLDGPGLAALSSQADYFKVAADDGGIAGFLLGLREGAAYDNPNFRWFHQRYPRFLYIDRVVVRQERRGSGVGTQLYADVETHARGAGVPVVVCEVNLQPANLASLTFHDRRGFVEVGTLALPSCAKVVSLQVKTLTPETSPPPAGW